MRSRLLFLICVLLLVSGPAKAGLDQELAGMFSDMINVTPGGSYETQRRGVITGGSIVSRNKVVNPNLISFVPPGAKAGCGGIDLYGGSFSFINSAHKPSSRAALHKLQWVMPSNWRLKACAQPVLKS